MLHTPDHEISGRKLTVENHKNGLSNAQFLQSQESREQAVEPHGRFREAKAHRSPVSEAGIAYLPRTMKPYAVRAEHSHQSNTNFRKTEALNNCSKARSIAFIKIDRNRSKNDCWKPNKCDSNTGMPLRDISGIPHQISDRNFVTQINMTPTSPESLSRTKKSKLSSAMCDLLKRHLSGSCSSELFQAHSLNEQNLRFKRISVRTAYYWNFVPDTRQLHQSPNILKLF